MNDTKLLKKKTWPRKIYRDKSIYNWLEAGRWRTWWVAKLEKIKIFEGNIFWRKRREKISGDE
jgi:hypothetical protein